MKQHHKGKILIFCDDDSVRRVLIIRLEKLGYDIITVSNNNQALSSIYQNAPDLIILDINVADSDNNRVCQSVRQISDIPIIIITTLGDVDDRVSGLDSGADDYLVKPFSLKELEARIDSILRRTKWKRPKYYIPSAPLKIGELEIDCHNRSVSLANQPLDLTDVEYEILNLLASNAGVLLSRDEIVQRIWGYVPYSQDNLRRIDVYISRLRNLIETNPRQPEYIFTERGTGYFFRRNDSSRLDEKRHF